MAASQREQQEVEGERDGLKEKVAVLQGQLNEYRAALAASMAERDAEMRECTRKLQCARTRIGQIRRISQAAVAAAAAGVLLPVASDEAVQHVVERVKVPKKGIPEARGGTLKVGAKRSSRLAYWRSQAKWLRRVFLKKYGKDSLLGRAVAQSQGVPKEHADVVQQILSRFFLKCQDVWADILTDKKVEVAAEELAMAKIQKHWESVALQIYMHCGLTEAAYQKLINLLSNVWDPDTASFERVTLDCGTEMPLMLSKDKLLVMKNAIFKELGLEVTPCNASTLETCGCHCLKGRGC